MSALVGGANYKQICSRVGGKRHGSRQRLAQMTPKGNSAGLVRENNNWSLDIKNDGHHFIML